MAPVYYYYLVIVKYELVIMTLMTAAPSAYTLNRRTDSSHPTSLITTVKSCYLQ